MSQKKLYAVRQPIAVRDGTKTRSIQQGQAWLTEQEAAPYLMQKRFQGVLKLIKAEDGVAVQPSIINHEKPKTEGK